MIKHIYCHYLIFTLTNLLMSSKIMDLDFGSKLEVLVHEHTTLMQI